MTLLRKTYKFLASLKLAVILLLSLAVILGTATYFESKYDAKTAAHLVYGSPFFAFFLLMLGVNVACAATIRYPWKKHQTGFVIVHLGIITILIGSFITRIFGVEGSMTLMEGQQSSYILIDEPQISYQIVKPGTKGASADPIVQVPAELRWAAPAEGNERRVPLGDGLVAVVDRYIHSAQMTSYYRPQTSKEKADNPAVHIVLTAGKGAPMAEGKVMADQWMSLADPETREIHMGPATIRLMRATTEEALKRALEPPAQSGGDASDGLLVVDVSGHPVVVPVAGNVDKEVAVEGTSYRLRIDRFLPYAVVQNDKLVNRSNEKVNPAVELTVLDGQGEAERQILFARYPDFSTTHHQSRPSNLKIIYTMEDTRQGGNGIDLVVGPDGKLYNRFYSNGGASRFAEAQIGQKVPTGWRMNLEFTVAEYLPRAEVVHEYKPWKGKEAMAPAIRMRVEGTDQVEPIWLQQGDMTTLTRHGGKEVVRLRYSLTGIPLKCKIKLDKFEVGYDPGTKTAATYSSNVHVDDDQGKSFDTVITMNEPLQHDGYTFFQASFSDGNGQGPKSSTFQVARDPGVPVKYAGSILLVIGIATYVFGKQPRNKSAAGDRKGKPTAEEVNS